MDDHHISLSFDPEDIARSNDIFFDQHERVINISETIERYVMKKQSIKPSGSIMYPPSAQRSSRLNSLGTVIKTKRSSKSSHSKSTHSSSSTDSKRLQKAQAELRIAQSLERFNRKSELLEKKKEIELAIERERVFQAQNKLEMAKLNEEFDSSLRFKENAELKVPIPHLSKTKSDEGVAMKQSHPPPLRGMKDKVHIDSPVVLDNKNENKFKSFTIH